MKAQRIHVVVLAIASLLMLITACSSSDGDDIAPTPTETTSVTGSVYASPVSGAAVIVKNASGNTVAGPVNAASDGTYSIAIPTGDLASDLRIESSSGTFIDEATGMSTPAGTLAAYVSGGTLTTGPVNLDPSSTVVHSLVTKYSKSVSEANASFTAAFGYTPDTSATPKNDDTSDATQRLAALEAGAFSQLTRDLGLAPAKQFDLLAALAQDLADGTLDGKNGSTVVSIGTSTTMPEDIENRFENALVSYLSNTTANLTGLTAADIGGALPFSKVALTDTYRVEYIPGMMAATEGKTSFSIKISKRSDGSAATGLTLQLMPLMHMATTSHSMPMDPISESATPGTYTCTVYYLMASGSGMGYWELPVMIGSGMMGEKATFYPAVGMAMGSDTVRATLKGVSDLISSGTASAHRSYYLFNDGLTSSVSMGKYDFKLFIATMESMMNFPSVGTGTTLTDEQSASWIVDPITVYASTDNVIWLPATEDTVTGHWSIAGLTGLSSGATGTLYVKMTINGEDKTTDGKVASGTNSYATLAATPPTSGM